MQLAVYGKGGIGKSTISANLSAALSVCGNHVLQIGCDPKHDSTRLLHHGQKVRTVLDYLLSVPKDEQKLSDVLMEGFGQTACLEAGGPRPGMGCAGRGILTAFEFLDRYDFRKNYDTILYDVLGDVVCGGFAVPVRKQYADAVFIVTSGERMAIYAANNILQGIHNLNPRDKRIAGIIYNSRGIGDDRKRVETFAKAAGLPILLSLPRSDLFALAESKAMTVVEMDEKSREAELFLLLAGKINEGMTLYPSCPLSEEEMECFMQEKAAGLRGNLPALMNTGQKFEQTEKEEKRDVIPVNAVKPAKKRALNDPFSRIPLFGCAFNGALALAIHVKDAAVLAHAPKSCVWFSMNGFTGYSRRGLYDRGILYPAFIPRNFDATDLKASDAIFGGVENAGKHASLLAERGAKYIIAVTACIPGLCGDDLEPIRADLKKKGVEMILVNTDGIAVGDYNEGMAYAYQVLARECIDREVKPEEDTINLVYEKTWSSRTDQNFKTAEKIFTELGIRINCRFVCATAMEDIKNFLKGRYSILVQDDALGQEIKGIFEGMYGARFLPDRLPRGFAETADFVTMLGRAYGKEEAAIELIERNRSLYNNRCNILKAEFSGLSAVIFINGGYFDWVFELVEDIGLMILKVFAPGDKRSGNAGWNRRFSHNWETDREAFHESLKELKPDLVLINDFSLAGEIPKGIQVINLMRESGVGFFSALEAASEWMRTLENKLEGGWKGDRSVFEKYYC